MKGSEAHVPDISLSVLHALPCAGAGGLALLHKVTGLDKSELIGLGAAGLVTHMSGELPGWRLTDVGRATGAE
ncbi:hypothetical protein [Streptomyces pacificus]|uniref:Uncharacterized protein n=1 Tax=Streptomyces pacificus TaxID=2705029 RepID=A0A6A0B4C2_9ACTN|nr:hypothetical protein [Streptomyces pacificus]GFH39545.1 hypothetical protein SCWH03_58130 [Streptomyces pacificus]